MSTWRIYIGSDHAGFELKAALIQHLTGQSHEVVDCGAVEFDANKVEGIRAALAWSAEIAKLAREHNNANVMSLGARLHTPAQARKIVDAFVSTEFSGSARHVRRIRQLSDYERTGELPTTSTGTLSEETESWGPPTLAQAEG